MTFSQLWLGMSVNSCHPSERLRKTDNRQEDERGGGGTWSNKAVLQ